MSDLDSPQSGAVEPPSALRYEAPVPRLHLRRLGGSNAVLVIILLPLLPSLLFGGLRLLERSMLFNPERLNPASIMSPPANAEEVWFKGNGGRLHGWLIRSEIGPARATVVYFHGNSGSIANVGWLGASLSARGFDALLFDYRGYGRSEGEIRDERDLFADADAAYDFIVGERGVSPERLALYGQSLGTAAAIDLGARRECGAVIVESGMSSARDMAVIRLPWLPSWLHAFSRNRLDSIHKIPLIRRPVLIAHGESDESIPANQGKSLFSAANEPKKLVLVPGGGHDLFGSIGDTYLDRVADFIREALPLSDGLAAEHR